MQRFLIFPPLIIAWLVSAQFGRMVVMYGMSWYTMQIARTMTDVYYHTPNSAALIQAFIPAIIIGAAMGTLFAALDFALHRHTRRTKTTAIRLIQNLIKSGIVAVVLVLLCQGCMFYLNSQFAHRRYHAYPPDMQWLNFISSVQVVIVIVALLWAMGKTLRQTSSEMAR